MLLFKLSLPGPDGLPVLTVARAEGLATPVIIQTARGAVGDRILGLNAHRGWCLPHGCGQRFDSHRSENRSLSVIQQALARRRRAHPRRLRDAP